MKSWCVSSVVRAPVLLTGCHEFDPRTHYQNFIFNDLKIRAIECVMAEQHKTCTRCNIEKILSLVGCTMVELKEYLQVQFSEHMSWDNYGKWEIDHIKPVASFDLKDIRQQQECFHYTNLQPLWAKDNRSKGKKILICT